MTQSTEIRADINLHFCLDLSTSLFMPKDEVLADVDVVVVVVEVIVKSDVFSNANFVSHYASTLTIDRHRRINFFPISLPMMVSLQSSLRPNVLKSCLPQ